MFGGETEHIKSSRWKTVGLCLLFLLSVMSLLPAIHEQTHTRWHHSSVGNPLPAFQCQLGVLPLGTGNDLARVLGWGPSCDDDTQLPQILEKLERASTKMLDRWSIMTFEIKVPPKHSCPTTPEGADDCQVVPKIITRTDTHIHTEEEEWCILLLLSARFSPTVSHLSIRTLCGHTPHKDPQLRAALCGHLLCQVSFQVNMCTVAWIMGWISAEIQFKHYDCITNSKRLI